MATFVVAYEAIRLIVEDTYCYTYSIAILSCFLVEC